MLDAFALAIIWGGGSPFFESMPEAKLDAVTGRDMVSKAEAAAKELRALAPVAGSYVAESDYFLSDLRERFWGNNYQRLPSAKLRYDPAGLSYVRHGVGRESRDDDGLELQRR